jgi:hypothetical protein
MLLLTLAIQIATGLLLPLLLARSLNHRRKVLYWLLLPGAIAGLALLLITPLADGLAARAAIALPASIAEPGLAVLIGLAGGLLAAFLLVIIFRFAARTVVTVPEALMVGLGVGGAQVMVRAALALLLLIANFRLIDQAPEEWGIPAEDIPARQADLDAYFTRAPIEPLADAGVAVAQLALYAALTVLLAAMFFTAQVGWFFITWGWGAVAEAGPVLFGRAGPTVLAIWWAIVGVFSLALIVTAARRVAAFRGEKP